MPVRVLEVRPNTYRDSVSLMLAAGRLKELDGVHDVALLIGTPANKRRLRAAGFVAPDLAGAGPNDLCVGIEAEDPKSLAGALEQLGAALSGGKQGGRSHGVRPRTLEAALRARPEARLVSISLPGEYAAAEARRALARGLHVFLFSDNIPIQEETELKQAAREAGLLLMGPDCGTARIAGYPLGFCNRVPDGPVGIVAASGTGAQEVMCVLAAQGIGVSHVIGTGSRDPSEAVGGVTFRQGVAALAEDPRTEVLVLVSKPPSPQVMEGVLELAARAGKPVVAAFVGAVTVELPAGVHAAPSLAEAAFTAAALARGAAPPAPIEAGSVAARCGERLAAAAGKLAPGRKWARGLYAGGTLADEAALVLARSLSPVRAGAGFGPVLPIEDWDRPRDHTLLDLGDDRFTQGRPHPMIDAGLRGARLVEEAADPEVAVLLIDVVLGLNADPDPAGSLLPWLEKAGATAGPDGGPVVIAHVCGTREDPQGLELQVNKLEAAGAFVFTTNVEAAHAAALVAGARSEGVR